MRVFSIQQPFAHLVVRGIKRLEVRTWTTDYRGPVAIHASARIPSNADVDRWFGSRETALRFAEQGWGTRDDLKALPYGAIVGVATLSAVHLGRELLQGNTEQFAWNDETERMELAERDPATGAMLVTRPRRKPIGVPLPENQYAWVFTDPLEIEPLEEFEGKQKLWTLDMVDAIAVERLVQRAKAKEWLPPMVSAAQRLRCVRRWKQRWESQRELIYLAADHAVRERRELASIRFNRKDERRFQEELKTYVAQHGIAAAGAAPGAAPTYVRVQPRFQRLLGGRDVVRVEEFELALRKRIQAQADAERANRAKERRRAAAYAVIDEAVRRAGSRAVHDAELREAVEHEIDRLYEEEEEDREFVRREIHEIGEYRAIQARMRKQAQQDARERRRREKEAMKMIASLSDQQFAMLMASTMVEEVWAGGELSAGSDERSASGS
jgi:hypothetical protein